MCGSVVPAVMAGGVPVERSVIDTATVSAVPKRIATADVTARNHQNLPRLAAGIAMTSSLVTVVRAYGVPGQASAAMCSRLLMSSPREMGKRRAVWAAGIRALRAAVEDADRHDL